jgi:hypothetical protein
MECNPVVFSLACSYMNQFSFADIISLLALLTAIGALVWNIVRDFVLDKVAIEFFVAFGEMGNIRDSNTSLFADAGSLLPDHKFDNPGMLIQIINTGRKPICVSSVGGKLKNGEHLSVVVSGLPKMLQPYEIFSAASSVKQNFIERIQKDEIKDLWVVDTRDKKWLLSSKGWKRLKSTVDYVASGKHL